jgi:hypothetical protein
MAQLYVSPVAYQSHMVIVHPDKLGQSLILRMPEFITTADGSRRGHPANIVWDEVQTRSELQYRWDEPDHVKRQWSLDLSGQAEAGDDELSFQVTMHNIGDQPLDRGAHLFCLQAGAHQDFQDYDGERTFVRLADRWASVNEMVGGVFEEHRMTGFQSQRDGVIGNIMAKVSSGSEWVLGIAINQDGGVSSNHQIWPSCIHANPKWPLLSPDEQEVVRGKVYFFQGGLDELYDRYRRDFAEG